MGMRSKLFRRLSLRQLEFLAVFAPLAFLAAVYVLVLGPVHPVFHGWLGFSLLAVTLAAAVLLFTRTVFGAVRSLQGEVETLSALTQRHNQQLVSLHGADLALMRETRVDDALRRIPEIGANLTDACHARLVTRGTAGAERSFTYPPGNDADAAPCCASDVAVRQGAGVHSAEPTHAASRGDRWLLDVPLAHLGTPVGALRLARARATAEPFDAIDEEIARMFATHAALVVQNDRLYDEVRMLAVEAERQALAREMHDSLAQVLAFVNTKAQAVEQYLRNADVPAARQQMAELSAAARGVYADIREGISALRVDVSGKTLRQLIDQYVTEFGESSGLRVAVDWSVSDTALELPPMAEVQLLRILQEALTNVRRHALASEVVVRVSADDGALVLVVTDDGQGFQAGARAPDSRPRFGLQTMTERAKAIGGSLDVGSTPGRGTRVRVLLPHAVRVAVGDEV